MKTKILPTDVTFTMRRQRGDGCLCSRCLLPIASERPIKPKGRKDLPTGNYELRYHSQCWNLVEARFPI